MKFSMEVENVTKWLNNYCFTLNVKQTATMYFANRHTLRDCPDVCVNGQKIKNVDELKCFGLTLDPQS